MRRALLDISAWAVLRGSTALSGPRRQEVAEAFEAGDIVVCLPFLLEAGYSARSAADHEELFSGLLSLPRVGVDAATEERAIDAQAQLGRRRRHRLPAFDLMMAAVADRNGLDVLHYDASFDIIANDTDLDFDSVWLAPRGSL